MVVIARVIVSVTTADDPEALTSRAFQNARKLSQDKLHLVLIQILKGIHHQNQHNILLQKPNIALSINFKLNFKHDTFKK